MKNKEIYCCVCGLKLIQDNVKYNNKPICTICLHMVFLEYKRNIYPHQPECPLCWSLFCLAFSKSDIKEMYNYAHGM